MDTALCCMAKQENRYLGEWVSYHLALGFSCIYIYDNNDPDGEHCADVLKKYIDDGKVIILDYRGRKQVSCQVQVAAYKDFYDHYASKYQWVMFLDVDEFLVFHKHKTVEEYLNEPFFRDKNCIRINWLCYSDNDLIHYDDRPVRERFTQYSPNNDVNHYYKSFFRTGIRNLQIPNVHYTSPISGVCMNNGRSIPFSAQTKLPVVNYDFAHVAHYCTKSMEEFVDVKRKRRSPGHSKNRLNFEFYWKYNKRTAEKERLLKEMMG